MAKPSIVLVHGFWGGATHWAKVIIQLSAMGYDSIAAVENPLTSLANDAPGGDCLKAMTLSRTASAGSVA